MAEEAAAAGDDDLHIRFRYQLIVIRGGTNRYLLFIKIIKISYHFSDYRAMEF